MLKNNSGNQNSGDRNSGSWNSGNWNSGNQNSGDRNSGSWNSGSWNSGDRNSGSCNSGSCNSGSCNSGNCNSGNYNSGHYNLGNFNSGNFNSNNPSTRLFNKIVENCIEIYIPDLKIKLNYWVSEVDMTDEEKKDNPEFYIAKGYLKTIPYKQAWKNFWDSASEEIKGQIKALPNFDPEVFYDITGIDVNVDLSKQKVEMIKEAEELLKKGNELLKKAKGIYC